MGSMLRLFILITAIFVAGCATVRPAPRGQIFVTAANPLAVEAGMNVLRRGGSAVDAAIAVQAMLSLVEPQSSGHRRRRLHDLLSTARRGGSSSMTAAKPRRPAPRRICSWTTMARRSRSAGRCLSGRATGVPGVVRMLHLAHGAHGRLPWSGLFGDAERTAREGFIVSPRLGRMIAARYPQNGAPDVRAYFAEADGTLLDPGDTLRNPAYADFLRRLAAEGPTALYQRPHRRTDRRAGPRWASCRAR